MHTSSFWLPLLACSALAPSSTLGAQVTVSDSAGMRIVTSTAPSRPTEAVRLSDTPRLVIGPERGKTGTFKAIRLVSVLSHGRVVVADGETGQLRYFDKTGQPLFVRPISRQPQDVRRVKRTVGDTIAAIVSYDRIAWFDELGAAINEIPVDPPSRPPSTFAMEILGSGHAVHAVRVPFESRPIGKIWAATMPLQLHDRRVYSVVDLGPQRMQDVLQRADGPAPIWLSPIAVIAGDATNVYLGYGSAFELRAHRTDGTLHTIIRRAWTPVPITNADWETWVVEWSKHWITTTGEQRERDVQAMRDAPWAETLPAFSQTIVDRTGKLWVRAAHWQDAIAAGSFLDMPAVPSEWSVFDSSGAWLYDVVMPPNFQVHEIGADYVAGVLLRDGRGVAAVFGLQSR